MFNFFAKIFDENGRKITKYQKVVDQINDLEPAYKKLSDKQLAGKTAAFKKEIASLREAGRDEKDILNLLLPDAFATVRETSRRVLGMRHFDVQLLAGIALHEGTVTEQKTGEGKTLTVTAPLYLNALLGRGVHLVTVNDYLAEVGVGWMGAVYHFLGLSCAVIVHDQAKLYNPDVDSEERGDERLEHFELISRRQAYAADITYGTNNEFGFDYLRDNMVTRLSDMVQRSDENTHHFAIVDEADSILIDEARTPLIISAPDSEPTKKYYDYARMVQGLTEEVDYKVDEKLKTANLTDMGLKRIEQKMGIENLYEQSFDTIHHVEAALKAKTLYRRDKEYIVRENQVIIVDEHTGRLMHGRRYSDGLHQAIEAKENATIQQESRTLATISLQNYFRLYHKLAGMSGTAVTEAEEFKQIYKMDVLPIPTNLPNVRQDLADVVYKTTRGKYHAVVAEVQKYQATGQPVLIGTRSIEHNQVLSDLLNKAGVTHQVLNAKNNEREAFIIADAGKKGSITVATNIAGRGVDIVLGGAKPELKEFRKTRSERKASESTLALAKELRLPPSVNPGSYDLKSYAKALQKWQEAHQEVVELGGLHILGSERHESRRIDNQLRGRSGRQGDPGSSQFFISLEDEIMRLFGGAQIAKLMDFLKIDENQPIEHGMVGQSIQSAQIKVEGFFFDQRKRLVEFDDVMNKQREIIYKRRRRLLQESETTHESATAAETHKLKEQILGYIENEVVSLVSLRAPQHFTADEYDAIVKEFIKIIPFDDFSQQELRKSISDLTTTDAIVEKLMDIVKHTYASREDVVGPVAMREIERVAILSTIDEKWMDHLDEMDNLRDGIWLRGDKTTVLSEYKKEGFNMFEELIASIESAIAQRIFRVHVQDQAVQAAQSARMIEQKAEVFGNLTQEAAQDPMAGSAPTAVPKTTKGTASDLAAALAGAKGGKKLTPGLAQVKVGRNDPCPCGAVNPKTGKVYKYKQCGLINAPWHNA
jgi:preprotein translocase subunit SecA